MHRIGHVRIQNFRACQSVSLPLGPYTPLVGQNNAGKSSILEALRWALKPAALKSSDSADPKADVEVVLKIEGITPELLALIPEQQHKAAIEPYCVDGVLWIRVSASGTSKPSKEVWDPTNCGNPEDPDVWRSYPTGLPEAVSVLLPDPLFIEAMDDIGEDLGKVKAGTTIKSLLDEVMAPVLASHAELNTALETIRDVLCTSGQARSSHLKKFDDDSTKALDSFFPGLALDLDLQMLEVKEFFKAGDLHVTDQATDDRRRFDQLGTGAQRAIQMALVRYLADMKNGDPGGAACRLLLIDEPELYLHPQGVRRLRSALHKLSQSGFQVIFTTHSPLMLSRDNAADTVVVCKTKELGTITRPPLRSAVASSLQNAESQSRTLFELGNAAEVYFSRTVVLCEGKTDRRLLPLAYEQVHGRAPEADGIAFVSLGSCSDIPKALPVLEAMNIPAVAVADLDFGFTHARVGEFAILDSDAPDMLQARTVLATLAASSDVTLGENGLPTRSKNGGPSAAGAWAIFASDSAGRPIAEAVHEDLKQKAVWVWPAGCIEDVTGCEAKGEEAIADQEALLLQLDSAGIRAAMPGIHECLEWIQSK